jgi:hypothetical protein
MRGIAQVSPSGLSIFAAVSSITGAAVVVCIAAGGGRPTFAPNTKNDARWLSVSNSATWLNVSNSATWLDTSTRFGT